MLKQKHSGDYTSQQTVSKLSRDGEPYIEFQDMRDGVWHTVGTPDVASWVTTNDSSPQVAMPWGTNIRPISFGRRLQEGFAHSYHQDLGGFLGRRPKATMGIVYCYLRLGAITHILTLSGLEDLHSFNKLRL